MNKETGLPLLALKRLFLNIRVLALIARNKWLRPDDLGKSYDLISASYDENWLVRLRSVTDKLLSALPRRDYETILDIGCGTGYTTAHLSAAYPAARITAVDVSEGMLAEARRRIGGVRVEFVRADMLKFLETVPERSLDCIVSAWSIGYSRPGEIIRLASRALRPSGAFAFVVNYVDTLAPVFRTFRRCMRRFPGRVARVMLPKFPRNWKSLEGPMIRSGLRVAFRESGIHGVMARIEESERVLPWLLGTGVLAGFDVLLPLHEEGELREFFERDLRASWKPLAHHYALAIGVKE